MNRITFLFSNVSANAEKNLLLISISTIKSGFVLFTFSESLADERLQGCDRFSWEPGATGTANTLSKDTSTELLEKGLGPKRGCKKKTNI